MLVHRALIVRATSKHLIAFSEMLSPRLPCLCLRPETAFEFVQYLLWAFHFSCHLSQRKKEKERERVRKKERKNEKGWINFFGDCCPLSKLEDTFKALNDQSAQSV